ncbi:16S rRNA (uracil1498-N3)-methyltransferase [Saccharopolyspora erythraea NRRL 2338]|uniref:Ribosomal RNA small subunit methyltransferase E n=2 Tax=Saccharopolyspora erythraea TaxID=1836 RepID=A4F9S8_SACEN|nr:16S rRNA (uracil(1498)-N(3))-methyltransferase [Saccharopolyspora erythraea]EQD83386.1 16S rRNA methyltransferase [Saccharopolyspora erythraea D]PFG94591.1 16S rRNA (uracil1498-N3)-methyltransferase [Saccharopolyspora erythraea NRRL 2338]QRK91328.1 16S rRNA (uracil(1498)-N(3))-methyltransferase [Saccharopolyspora erythraea]CAM00803.1 protein involving differentiation [Saccharopolyspora erythraea NRRL 2338]
MSLPVFSVDEVPAAGRTALSGPEGRHAATVRRIGVGEQLLLSDGRGGMARCSVTSTARDSLELDVEESWLVPRPALRVRLAQALVKGDRGELAVELATEAGVDGVLPWKAARCVARWDDGPRGAKALGRWRSTVAQAAKQARRPWTPEVGEPVTTRQLSRVVAEADAAVVLHESASTPLASVDLPAEGELVLVVGPEGGVGEDELAVLTEAGAQAVRLGPSVLRASTAAAVALGALGVLTHRWDV